MSRRPLLSIAAGVLALAACSPESKIDPLRITSPAQLPQAIVGTDYAYSVDVAGGTAPFVFSADIPANIGWLTIDPATGQLAGIPTAEQLPAVSFLVNVADANQQTARATLTLGVIFCVEGEVRDCTSPGAGQCLTSHVVCASDQFPQCPTNGTPSTDIDHCGAGCTPCDRAKADRCAGTCECGDGGGACDAATTCCSGGCVDVLTDAANCGACGTACATAPAFGHPACTAGGCDFACDAGYTRCGSACVKLTDDVSHCGSCDIACQGIDPVCNGGQCYASCPQGTTNCNGACLAPSAFLSDPVNCGGCGVTCTAPAGAYGTCSGGTCSWACDAGLSVCGGACVNLQSSQSNCGACANACPADTLSTNWFCSGGYCDFSCKTGYYYCVDTDACQRTGTSCGSLCKPSFSSVSPNLPPICP